VNGLAIVLILVDTGGSLYDPATLLGESTEREPSAADPEANKRRAFEASRYRTQRFDLAETSRQRHRFAADSGASLSRGSGRRLNCLTWTISASSTAAESIVRD